MMTEMSLSRHLGPYPSPADLVASFREIVSAAKGRESVAGFSWEGRSIPRFDLGAPGGPAVLLTSLVHGTEIIGALALREVLARLPEALLDRARFVVLPVVNPDALDGNHARLARGRPAWQRCNARGVDLNRNFPLQSAARSIHPMSGSRRPWSPYYAGTAPLSEPESRVVHGVAAEISPHLALSFHSFGGLLLYPFAHTARPHPLAATYRALGAAFNAASPGASYTVQTSRSFYPVMGDLDDHLDAAFGSLALTVEVGRLDLGRDLRRVLNPFCWMNPRRVGETVAPLAPATAALVEAALALPSAYRRPEPPAQVTELRTTIGRAPSARLRSLAASR
jgi:predicted deacylase